MRSVEPSGNRDSKAAEAVKIVFLSALDMLRKGWGGGGVCVIQQHHESV